MKKILLGITRLISFWLLGMSCCTLAEGNEWTINEENGLYYVKVESDPVSSETEVLWLYSFWKTKNKSEVIYKNAYELEREADSLDYKFIADDFTDADLYKLYIKKENGWEEITNLQERSPEKSDKEIKQDKKEAYKEDVAFDDERVYVMMNLKKDSVDAYFPVKIAKELYKAEDVINVPRYEVTENGNTFEIKRIVPIEKKKKNEDETELETKTELETVTGSEMLIESETESDPQKDERGIEKYDCPFEMMCEEEEYSFGLDRDEVKKEYNPGHIVLTGWLNADKGTTLDTSIVLDHGDNKQESGKVTIQRYPRDLSSVKSDCVGEIKDSDEAGFIITIEEPSLEDGRHELNVGLVIGGQQSEREELQSATYVFKTIPLKINSAVEINEQEENEIADRWQYGPVKESLMDKLRNHMIPVIVGVIAVMFAVIAGSTMVLLKNKKHNGLEIKSIVLNNKGRVRKNNEDNYYLDGNFMQKEKMDDGAFISHSSNETIQLYAVCDGMGGTDAGEDASFRAVSELSLKKDQLEAMLLDEHLIDALQMISDTICDEAEEKMHRSGTTITMVLIHDGEVTFANIGDSRTYRFRDGKLKQISMDHSKVQRMIAMGIITPEQARTDPNRHIITQYLGMPKEIRVSPYIKKEKIHANDIYLLCSDGLTDMVEDGEIEMILSAQKDIKDAAKQLMKEALTNGGKDNVTIMLVHAQE